MPRGQNTADEKRLSLIRAAYYTIAEKGFEGLRIQEVAAQVGIHHATLYHYFPKKEDLILAVVEYLRQQMVTTPDDVPGIDYTTPPGIIRSTFLVTRYRLQKTPELYAVMNELTLRSTRNPIIQKALKHMDSRWHWFLSHTLAQGIEQGVFRADLDPKKTATMLMIMIGGILRLSVIDPDSLDFDHIIKDVEKLLCT